MFDVVQLSTANEPADEVAAEALEVACVSKNLWHLKVGRLPSPLSLVFCPTGKPPPFTQGKRDDRACVLFRQVLDFRRRVDGEDPAQVLVQCEWHRFLQEDCGSRTKGRFCRVEVLDIIKGIFGNVKAVASRS